MSALQALLVLLTLVFSVSAMAVVLLTHDYVYWALALACAVVFFLVVFWWLWPVAYYEWLLCGWKGCAT